MDFTFIFLLYLFCVFILIHYLIFKLIKYPILINDVKNVWIKNFSDIKMTIHCTCKIKNLTFKHSGVDNLWTTQEIPEILPFCMIPSNKSTPFSVIHHILILQHLLLKSKFIIIAKSSDFHHWNRFNHSKNIKKY